MHEKACVLGLNGPQRTQGHGVLNWWKGNIEVQDSRLYIVFFESTDSVHFLAGNLSDDVRTP